jgi:hypothetical protein
MSNTATVYCELLDDDSAAAGGRRGPAIVAYEKWK